MAIENRIQTPEAPTKDDRLKEVMDRLQEGTEAVLTSEGFSSWLKLLSHLHQYSYSNVILIHAQKPDATIVNSYDRWKQLGRQVNKGEHGLKIFFPIFRKYEDQDTGEKKRSVVSFGVGNVFDVSQTSGDPLPKQPIVEDSDTREDDHSRSIYSKIRSHLKDQGVELMELALPSTIGGYYSPGLREIVINRDRSLTPQSYTKVRTLVHEAAHFTAGHGIGDDRHDAEAVAEGSSFATLYHFGLSYPEHSFNYVASWARDPEVVKKNLSAIQTTTHTLITAIEQVDSV